MVKHLNSYERNLIEISKRLLGMSGLVGARFSDAMKSLIYQDSALAEMVIKGDDEVDAGEENLEMECLELISLQQPIDHDLRFLAAAMRIARELERIGDYACDIAKLVIGVNTSYFKPLLDISLMAELVRKMLEKSLKAYFEKDLSLARQLDDDDSQVDELFLTWLAELTGYMKQGPEYVDQACGLLLATRYLERIGDHIVNIAEMVVFIETGERHPFKLKKQKQVE
jgi:phosphate transport system protein